MNLSEHFTLEEMCHSATADAHKIQNTATSDVQKNLSSLCCMVLEPLRAKLGKPITILSGFRCPELNKLVGGVMNSQHQDGKAADITVEGMTHTELAEFIKNNLQFDQLILECVKPQNPMSGWVHVSWNGSSNRNMFFEISA